LINIKYIESFTQSGPQITNKIQLGYPMWYIIEAITIFTV